ncbi:MAG: glycoside hydrolase family 2 [Clostridia bacterium]|nr:glycoside hydrolase family 2 [Clostridia bacterium]
MAEKDVFANIANNSVSGRKDLLKEILPNDYPRKLFVKNDVTVEYEKMTYEENVKDFKKGILQLTEQFKPFLKRHASPLPVERKRSYINTFDFRFENEQNYRKVNIPHYHGPVGRWTSEYLAEMNTAEFDMDKKIYLVFKGVDYYCDVYVNNEHVTYHEGFFAKFECDITKYCKDKIQLKIIVRNDIPTIGNNNMHVNGDKLYAATGLGWDDPQDGWHHCPAGGGIFDKVYLEQREEIFIKDIFVRPDIDNKKIDVTVNVFSHIEENTDRELLLAVLPCNFISDEKIIISKQIKLGYGDNFYQIESQLDKYKLWECDSPYLYMCQCQIDDACLEATFGMRKFHMDEMNEPKGTLYLNNNEIILRGANEMGHLQLCVARDDYDQLIEDILIAKYCHMNCYRITQRPVQEEIYDYCDRLGMLNQVDLPLFGYMRKNKFFEGIKQAGEMERLVRNHPSVIVATYINEPFAPEKYSLSHRHLSRKELELFFDACDAAIYFENPDRVIKRVEGDYDPPTNKGLSDFHCYNMWYTNHAIPLGMLYKGYLPAVKIGWKTGCGEYGAEGLDNYEVMRKYYPEEWLPEHDEDYWIPDKIIKSQTNTMHGDWYEEQSTIKEWINESQHHQAFATKLMTEAFRRRNDVLIYTAIHLLIDAWPSGWMKTLLDVDRVPKQSYFAFRDSLQPLKASLRCDRWQAYENEIIDVEAWLLNDSHLSADNLSMMATIRDDEKVYESYLLDSISSESCRSKLAGIIQLTVPQIDEDSIIYVDIELLHNETLVNKDRFVLKVFKEEKMVTPVYAIGDAAKKYVSESRYLKPCDLSDEATVLISSPEEYLKQEKTLSDNHLVFIMPDQGDTYMVEDNPYTFTPIFPEEIGENCDLKGLSFIACDKKIQNEYGKDGFSYWYNSKKGYIDHVATRYVKGEFDKILAHSFEKPSFGKITTGQKNKLPVVACCKKYTFISLEMDGRLNDNPVLDRLLINIIKNMEEV